MNAWDIVSSVLIKMAEHVSAGVTTQELDAIGEREIKRLGATSYNKGYQPSYAKFPFPTATCVSVNDEIAHGIPSETTVLKNGDLVHIDLGIIAPDGQCGDAAMSIPVGEMSEEDRMLVRYAQKILFAGIDKVKTGCTVYDIAKAMETKAMERNMLINHQLCGHGIGKDMHEDPYIYQVTNHYHTNKERFDEYQPYMDIKLTEGQLICLEPCVTNGRDKWGVIDPTNGWVWRTRDGKKSAMFEHMMRVTKDGAEVLTHHFERMP